jgi:hypothetical protein
VSMYRGNRRDILPWVSLHEYRAVHRCQHCASRYLCAIRTRALSFPVRSGCRTRDVPRYIHIYPIFASYS